VFGVLNAFYDVGLAAEVMIVIGLAGEVTSAISYLLVERAIRPVTARALAAGPPERPAGPGVGTRLVLAWSFSSGVLLSLLALIAVAVLAGTPSSTNRLAATVLFLSAAGFVAGWAAVAIAARSVAEPVESVRHALAEVEKGNTEVEAPVDDGSEIGLLQAGFNRMVVGLRERELLRDLFGRHVGEDVARHALERGLELGGEVREVAVLFVDLIGSTTLAATKDARAVVNTLNEFFGIVVEEVSVHGGWINKFEGDAALCVFGAPTPHPDAAGSALATARSLCRRLERELPETPAGIGLSAGPVVAGNVGTAERLEYTVIGDPVNEAARLTDMAKTAPGRLLASQAILDRAGVAEREQWRLDETVTLRGRTRPTRVASPR
jgi:adenylate cyclase